MTWTINYQIQKAEKNHWVGEILMGQSEYMKQINF